MLPRIHSGISRNKLTPISLQQNKRLGRWSTICGSPLPFAGSVICSGTKFNDFCSLSCPLGYILAGDGIRTCQENGVWSNTNMSCIPVKCPPLSAANASVKCSRELEVDSQCIVTCNSGYLPNTRTSFGTSYTRTCESSGRWSNEDLQCLPVNCKVPTSRLLLPGGGVTCSGSGYGHTCRYACLSGFYLDGPRVRVCGAEGTWTSNNPLCRPVVCGPLENVDNAHVFCESQQFGGVCHIQCKPGFLVDGTLGVTSYKRSCTAVALWNGSTLACEQNRDSCFMPQPLLNGRVKCSGWFVNDVCQYRCISPFTLVGSNTTTCLTSGQWSGKVPKCVQPRCSPLDAGLNAVAVVCPVNIRLGCVVVCKEGFQLTVKGKRYCNQTWSSSSADCEEYDYCLLGRHNCKVSATCVSTGRRQYACQCNQGYAGNGTHCALDTDADGWPDEDLACVDSSTFCSADNCPYRPNSGQEDSDGDGLGDACDLDDDNDGIIDTTDNCRLVASQNQNDTDADGVGDICDNCWNVKNSDQADTDNGGAGDACDTDADNDLVTNTVDNCPFQFNPEQSDTDGDGVGDVCDNCQRVNNTDQSDNDENGLGDACDDGVDEDRDGIIDGVDNCDTTPNPSQVDTDGDGFGDACTADDDGDGVTDDRDNCWLVYNLEQADSNDDGIGDYCEDDLDGDGVSDSNDVCPLNPLITKTDFSRFSHVAFKVITSRLVYPLWIVNDNGAEIVETANIESGMAIGRDVFGYVEYSGTLFIAIDDDDDDDYAGFVFAYQSNRKFYVCKWKKAREYYNIGSPRTHPQPSGLAGIQLNVVESKTGPGLALKDAMWNTGNVVNESRLLWSSDPVGWESDTSYRWRVTHNPENGYIRIVWTNGLFVIADSGAVYDTTHFGGRLGVFVFSQKKVTFSHLNYRCLENTNYGLSYNGTSGISVGKYGDLGIIDSSFTLEAWIFINQCNQMTCEFVRSTNFGHTFWPSLGPFFQSTDDDSNWIFINTATPSRATGPKSDHTGDGGYYIYIEGSVPQLRGAQSVLQTECFPSSPSCTLTLWYHMYDNVSKEPDYIGRVSSFMGSMMVDVKQGTESWRTVFYVEGDQGDEWHEAFIDLAEFSGGITVRVTGTVGAGFSSDLAIDDVTFSDGCGLASQCSALSEKPIFGTSSGTGIYAGVIDGKLHAGMSGSSDVISTVDVDFLTWSHVAIQYDRPTGTQSVHINGRLVNQTISSVFSDISLDNSLLLLVGQNGTNVLNCAWIDELRLWGAVVDLSATYNRYLVADQTPNLKGYWKFDEGSGNSCKDEASGNDATLPVDGPKWIASSLELRAG